MSYIPHGTIFNTRSDDSQKGIFSSDSDAKAFPVSDGVTVRLAYTAREIPIPNIPWNSVFEMQGIATEKGASIVELELAPHSQTAMHSTSSVDVGIVITGEIVLSMDSGEEKTLK